MTRTFWIVVFTCLLLLLDVYVFQAVKTVTHGLSSNTRKIIYYIYWGVSILTFAGILLFFIVGIQHVSSHVRNFFITFMVGMFLSKTLVAIFLLFDDIQRGARWLVNYFYSPAVTHTKGNTHIPRAEFLSKAGLIIGTIPILTMSYGVLSGAHNYQVRRQRIGLKNLPESFNGLKIAQVSDIHTGSFFDKDAVRKGIQLLLNQKPDMVFFTGDLVNHEAGEMEGYTEVFEKIKAPMGVYSILGNHDYGDYIQWPSPEAKQQNLNTLINIHKQMGWDILLNENRIFERNGEKIAVLGVENWSAKSNFPKYGKLSEAYKGSEEAAVKLLLSHDPSHWRAKVIPGYKDIDITFSGHTHGFQFGVEIGNIKWSPVQYVYNEWAGLYKEAEQFLYVNRGFGYIGFPGRIGMNPEITIIELVKV